VTDSPAVGLEPADQLTRAFRSFLEFDARVQVFGVLANDDEVDVLVTRAHSGIAFAGTHLAEEIQCLAEGDIDRAEASPDRRRDRTLESDAVARNRLEHVIGQRIPLEAVHNVGAGILDLPLEIRTARLQHTPRRVGDLRPRSVARDERDAVSHRRPTLPAWRH